MNGARHQSWYLRAAGISPRGKLQKEGLARSIFLSRCLRSLPFISRFAGKERNAAILPHPAAVSPCREEAVSIRHRARKLVPLCSRAGSGQPIFVPPTHPPQHAVGTSQRSEDPPLAGWLGHDICSQLVRHPLTAYDSHPDTLDIASGPLTNSSFRSDYFA